MSRYSLTAIFLTVSIIDVAVANASVSDDAVLLQVTAGAREAQAARAQNRRRRKAPKAEAVEGFQLPDDEATLINILGMSVQVSRCQQQIESQDEHSPYGALQDNPSPPYNKAQKLVSIQSEHFGHIHALVSKYFTGFLPGTPVDSCGELPPSSNVIGSSSLCENYYEKSTGFDCKLDSRSSCQAGSTQIDKSKKMDDLCTVTILGTDFNDPGNVRADFDFPTTRVPEEWEGDACKQQKYGCWAHDGFLGITTQLMQPIKDTAKDFQCAKLMVSGHSLGGAVALLLGWALGHAGLPVVGVYTYESPRVADTNLAASMDQEHFSVIRVTHTADVLDIEVQDIVPLVPPPFTIYNYIHYGEEVNYHKHDRTVCNSYICESVPYLCGCSEKLPSADSLIFPWAATDIHINYGDTPLKYNIDARLACPFQDHPTPLPPPTPSPAPKPPAKCTLAYHDPYETGSHKPCCENAKQCGPRKWWKQQKLAGFMCIPVEKNCELTCTLPYLQPVNGSRCCDGTTACVLGTGQTVCTHGYCPCGKLGEECCTGFLQCQSIVVPDSPLRYPLSCAKNTCCIPSSYDCDGSSCEHCCSGKHGLNPVGGQQCL